MTTCHVCGSDLSEASDLCPQCGAKVVDQTGIPGDASVADGLPRRILRIALPLVVVVGLYAYWSDAFREFHPVIAAQPEVSVSLPSGRINSTVIQARIEGPFLIVSLKEIEEKGIVRFFDPANIQDIPVVAYVAPTGRLVTAMSISEACRSRDFYIEGENIHCANCPSYWNASSLEAYACCQKYYPDPIPSTILGDEVRIELETVRSWQARS